MKARLWLIAGLVVGIAGLTALAVRADVFSDLGLLPGGSVLLLPPAELLDPPPAGSAKEPLVDETLTPAAFTCSGGATSTTPSFGYVILNTHGPKDMLTGKDTVVTVEVVVKDGIPYATYQIFVNQDPGGCPTTPSGGTVTTNAQGNGNGHVAVSRVSTATNFWVSAFDLADYPTMSKSLLRSPAATLD